MSHIAVRPRFKKLSQLKREELERRIKERLQNYGSLCTGHFVDGFIVLRIPKQKRHFWSPELSLSFEQREDGTLVRGLYGPDPALWAFFFYGRAITLLVACFISVGIFSEWWLNKEMKYEAPFALSLGVGAALYAIAQVGRKLGEPQTYIIHTFIEDCLGEYVELD